MNNKNNKKNKKGKKKSSVGKKILLTILLILVILIGCFTAKTIQNGGGLKGILSTILGTNEEKRKDLKEIRVLVLGVSTDLDSELTDTIMVVSYNPNTQKANILSIPRDTFTGKNPKRATASQKINSIYNINKDPNDTLKAVNELTGLNIQYYAVVKTEALIKLVDAIGGVKFNVPIDMQYDDTSQDLHIDLKAGEQVLDGDKAEQLLRWRHSNANRRGEMSTYPTEYGNDDFGRMRTQRDFIISTLKQTVQFKNITKIGQILEIANQNIETNIELNFIKDYVPYIVDLDTENDIKSAALPVTTPSVSETNGVSIAILDKKAAQELIQSMFYADEQGTEDGNSINTTNSIGNNTSNITGNTISTETNKEPSEITIELLNGTNDKEKLAKAKEKLENGGYKVKKTGNSSTLAKTVITNKKGLSDENLKQIRDVLGDASISINPSSISTVDVSIIIGTDFN